jgi:UDP-N-acetylglucosamine 4,6-dehydratase/5-epimerase
VSFWQNKSVLVTGGCGSLGSAIVESLLATEAKKIVIFNRDEYKLDDKRLRFFIGDVRDKSRLATAFSGMDVIIHTAALKRIEVGERDPIEFIKTNVYGSQNVIEAAIECNVEKVMGISTDKASGGAVNLYGACKLVMERLFVQGNSYVGSGRRTRFACVRYGNVVNSRGSVVQIFKEQLKSRQMTVTDLYATRFWITLPQAVEFVLSSIESMKGGEVFVPKLKAASVRAVYEAIDKEAVCNITFTGLRNGEKMHEVLLSEGELDRTKDIGDRYVVTNDYQPERISPYASNLVEQMSVKEVRQIIDSL